MRSTGAYWPRRNHRSTGSWKAGITELKDKLGPILWQFAPTKRFDEGGFREFLDSFPKRVEGQALRHVVEVRHDSFCVPGFIALARKAKAAIVSPITTSYPLIADVTSDFVYARLQRAQEDEPTGYPASALARGPNAPRPGQRAARLTISSRSAALRPRPRSATCSFS